MDQKEATQAALEIVKAQASVRAMTDIEINSMIASVSAGILAASKGDTVMDSMADIFKASVIDPQKAVTERAVVCLECGKKFKILTKKHLGAHGLTPEEYRAKHGMKKGAPLIAKGLQRERRKKMKDMKLWERRGQQEKAE
jgi:predicted transcriptional regulator